MLGCLNRFASGKMHDGFETIDDEVGPHLSSRWWTQRRGTADMQSFGTTQPSRRMPPMPEIGHPESFYAKKCHEADYRNDHNAHEACKVGQYVTLALDPSLQWEQK